MKTKHILVFEHDIQKYPPILSVINYLFSLNKEIVLIGYSSNISFIDDFKQRGGVFYNVITNRVTDNFYIKIINYFRFKNSVYKIISNFESNESKLWLFGEPCIWLLHDLVNKFESNLYLFEIPSFKVNLRYRMFSPIINYAKTLRSASKVVCCEYNRAHITKSFFQLDELPVVIPNKPYILDHEIDESHTTNLIKKLNGRKIILYQGIFNYPERRMDEFCEAMSLLSSEYLLCLMGSENDYKKKLKRKYEGDNIIFLPYISAPNHLAITKLAHIGILVYNAEEGNIENTLNTLFCAPNKIFEYAKYGIPMISNDVPALNNIFSINKCGQTIPVLNKITIAAAILEIFSNYSIYSTGSTKFFEKSNLNELYSKLL